MSDNRPEGRLQNIRGFTVQIRDAAGKAIIGTGFAVDRDDGLLVTCKHVVIDASSDPFCEGALVWVYFPQLPEGADKLHHARLVRYFSDHDDDVVVLQIDTLPLPSQVEIAVLGSAADSLGHEFKSFGYRRLANYQGLPTTGDIIDFADKPPDKVLHGHPLMLRSQHIDSGMSGAAVLDKTRNLVVGVIAETWDSGREFADRDTSFAIDGTVLRVAPLNLRLRAIPYPLRAVPQPKTDVDLGRVAAISSFGISLFGAPAPLEEWAGRPDLLQVLSADWVERKCLVTGLTGLGGEGKNSLARRWLESLLTDQSLPRPDSVFWWSFYERRSADEFLDAALAHIGGGRIQVSQFGSSLARAHLIAATLTTGRYLFILDGLEVMQYEDGDQYGLLWSSNLRDFLCYFAAPGHESFCLITSRIPIVDLMTYTTYRQRNLSRLNTADGRALLRNLGVTGSDEALEQVVEDWDGHALTLSLLGSYLVDQYRGEVASVGEIPKPTADEPRYHRVHRVLRRYDAHLTDSERALLKILSAFRGPVVEAAIAWVFGGTTGSIAPFTELDGVPSDPLLKRLVTRRMLRYDPHTHCYTAHPLVRNHYYERLRSDPAQLQAVHGQIKNYFLSVARDIPRFPTLEALVPLIEGVYHACRAETYDEAFFLLYDKLYRAPAFVFPNMLGAWETDLALIVEFFPNGDTSRDPLVTHFDCKRFILNQIGLCLMNLGRLSEAQPFYERHNLIAQNWEDWFNASRGYGNLAELYGHLGALAASDEAAYQALELARRAKDKLLEINWLSHQAWIAHLRGDVQGAGALFQQAETLERKADPKSRYLYSRRGINHADYLRRAGKASYAQSVAKANLAFARKYSYATELSLTHRILGDLDADAGKHERARKHYNTALKIGRSVSNRDVLIEVLTARGRWAARRDEVELAYNDLEEALGYAVEGHYRVYEVDIHSGLAWAHYAAGDLAAAREEAKIAQMLSAKLGYHWGNVEAAEILAQLDRDK